MKHTVAADIGGTKILLDAYADDGRRVFRKRLDTAAAGKGSLRVVETLCSELAANSITDVGHFGIAINAAVRDNAILKSSVLGVEDYPLGDELSKRYGCTVRVENDVVAFALAESREGFGKTYRDFVVLNIGTGTRVAHCVDGTVTPGYKGLAGEISQMPWDVPGIDGSMLFEDAISGRGIAALYGKFGGGERTAREILAEQSAPADKTRAVFTRSVSRLFGMISYFYNPEAVICTGSVFDSSPAFLDEAYRSFLETNFSFFHFRLHRSELEDGHIRGVLTP